MPAHEPEKPDHERFDEEHADVGAGPAARGVGGGGHEASKYMTGRVGIVGGVGSVGNTYATYAIVTASMRATHVGNLALPQ